MPALTVVSSTYEIMGPPDKDGSYFLRGTFVLSDGSEQSVDITHAPAGSNPSALLATMQANLATTLAIVPSPVLQSQARAAIYAAGLKAAVEAAVAAADVSTQALWYTAAYIDRDNPLVIALGAQLGLTSAQIDDLFRVAATLPS